MLRSILTDRKEEVGAQLLSRLDQLEMSITTALWYYYGDSNNWRLIIASPGVRRKGPKHFYQVIQSFLLKLRDRPISLSEIQVIDDNDPFVLWLRSSYGNLGKVTDAHLDQLITGAVVYRWPE